MDAWNETIASDLEQLAENSGFDYARTLVPNMVAKGKDEEVQDGLKGAILPKDLIAERFFTTEKYNLNNSNKLQVRTKKQLTSIKASSLMAWKWRGFNRTWSYH